MPHNSARWKDDAFFSPVKPPPSVRLSPPKCVPPPLPSPPQTRTTLPVPWYVQFKVRPHFIQGEKMSLLPAVQRKANDPRTSVVHKCILDFLIANAVGSANAQPWEMIEIHLAACGYTLSQNAFQQGLLKNSRENGYFIGSFDHGTRGYFIIDTQQDAELMRDWYTARITKEQARIASLQKDAASVGWTI